MVRNGAEQVLSSKVVGGHAYSQAALPNDQRVQPELPLCAFKELLCQCIFHHQSEDLYLLALARAVSSGGKRMSAAPVASAWNRAELASALS